jgi:hypothetical protein
MSQKVIDLTGKVFGRLKVIRFYKRENLMTKWECLCECGNTAIIAGHNLGRTQSCGCLQKETVKRTSTKHGMGKTSEARCWRAAKNRCVNPKNSNYKNYGARGITMCDRWMECFENFIEDMGMKPSPNLTLERIDNEKGYCPENCKWDTQKNQAGNRRTSRKIECDGITNILSDWERELNVKKSTLRCLLKLHSIEDAVTYYTIKSLSLK